MTYHELSIPKGLHKKIDKSSFYPSVINAFDIFGEVLKDNKLYFFPEYTDHGIRHLGKVINSAYYFISSESWRYLSSEDGIVLLLSSLFHDLGMHIFPVGFVKLIQDDSVHNGLFSSGDNDISWKQLYLSFLSEIGKSSESRQNEIGVSLDIINKTKENPSIINDTNKSLIAAFIRDNHHRLAHYIALKGFPGDNNLVIAGLPTFILDIAGFVAKSHGMNLREATNILSPSDRISFYNVHLPVLMAALRISDYLDIERDRAPGELIRIKGIHSRASMVEWNFHSSIEHISYDHPNPETIWVRANPPDIRSFDKVSKVVHLIQSEFDQCWSFLGEIYGRDIKYSKIKFNFRRIDTNILSNDQVNSFNYYPVIGKLGSKSTELLPLLINPLYGDDPFYAFRELIQNSLDAVLEMRDILDFTKMSIDQYYPIGTDVYVVIVPRSNIIRISDKGVGMTLDTVLNYFLMVGASFRKSDFWQEKHTLKSQSRVSRSGKFGIGVLASFLLGNTIKVKTRHYSCPMKDGISFSYSINDEIIQFNKESLPVGTQIEIYAIPGLINNIIMNNNLHNIYCFDDPKVIISIIGHEKLNQKICISRNPRGLSSEWREMSHPIFDHLAWKLFAEKDMPRLICNGLAIIEPGKHYDLHANVFGTFDGVNISDNIKLHNPSVSVKDNNFSLNINLQRTRLTGPMPHIDLLIKDIIYDFIGYLIHKMDMEAISLSSPNELSTLSYPLISADEQNCPLSNYMPIYAVGENGLSIIDLWLSDCLPDRIIIYPKMDVDKQFLSWPSSNITSCFFNFDIEQLQDRYSTDNYYYLDNSSAEEALRDDWLSFLSGNIQTITPFGPLANLSPDGVRIFSAEKLLLNRRNRLALIDEHKTGEVYVYSNGNCPDDDINYDELYPDNIEDMPYIGIWYRPVLVDTNSKNVFLRQVWNSVISSVFLSFDHEKRMQQLNIEVLRKYIDRHTEQV